MCENGPKPPIGRGWNMDSNKRTFNGKRKIEGV